MTLSNNKTALVFGASGQAGSYLVEQLLEKGYKVIGTFKSTCFAHKKDLKTKRLRYRWLDFEDNRVVEPIVRMIEVIKPDEIYNLASIMFAMNSWNNPRTVLDVNGSSVITILDAIQRYCPYAKFVQAGSADSLSTLSTPYGLSKKIAYDAVRLYREQKGLHASTAIFYNMESPRRDPFFFSQKVVRGVVDLHNKMKNSSVVAPLELGPLNAIRDWGWAPEYMEAMHLMSQKEEPDDYVIATGQSTTCRDFVYEVYKRVMPYQATFFFNEDAKDAATQTAMFADGDEIQRTKEKLGWEAKFKFADVVRELVNAEIARVEYENSFVR